VRGLLLSEGKGRGKNGKEKKSKGDGRGDEVEGRIWLTQKIWPAQPMTDRPIGLLREPGASKGTPDHAKCVTEILSGRKK